MATADNPRMPNLRALSIDSTLDALFETYDALQLFNGVESTRRQYGVQFRHFGRFLGRPGRISDLTDEALTAFLTWFRAEGHAEPTCNKARSHLLAMARFACKKNILHVWPTVRALREPERLPQAWTIEQMQALLQACKRRPGWIEGVRACHWWTALLLVLWDSGERIGALLRVTWKHVDATTGWLTVPAEYRKGRTADKLFKLGCATLAALKAIEYPPRDLVFAWERSYSLIWKHYEAILRDAGLPAGRRDKFHRVRRSVASHAEANGANATNLLGHSSRRVTELYLDPRIVERPQPADVLPPLDDSRPTDHAYGQELALAPLLDEFAQHLVGSGAVRAEFRDEYLWRIRKVVDELELTTVAQLNGQRINLWIAKRYDPTNKTPIANTTAGHYRRTFCRFCRWLGTHKNIYGAAAECANRMVNKQRQLGQERFEDWDSGTGRGRLNDRPMDGRHGDAPTILRPTDDAEEVCDHYFTD